MPAKLKKFQLFEETPFLIKKLMMKVVGEPDYSAKEEVMHHILSLKFVSSSFQGVNVSLDWSRCLQFKSYAVETNPSTFDQYSIRETYQCFRSEIKKVVVRVVPNLSGSPNNKKFPDFCKYQLIKYKPWTRNIPVYNTDNMTSPKNL